MAMAVLLLAGCERSDAPDQGTASSTPSPPVIALVMKTLTNPFFVEMERGARVAAGELGVDLVVKTAAQETSIVQQIELVQELIHQGVDAIVIAPGDSLELIPALKRARDQGVVIVNLDNRLDPDFSRQHGLEGVPFISVDNRHGAFLAANALADALAVPGKVAILEGIPGAANAEDRLAGARAALSGHAQVTGIVSATAHWKIDEAYAVTRQLLRDNPDIVGIVAANDMMALGALRHLADAGRSDIPVAGFDALDEALAIMGQGRLVATVDQQAARQGELGVRFAVDLLHRRPVPMETLVDVRLITRDGATAP